MRALGLRAGDRPPLEFDGYGLYAGGVPRLHIADRAPPRARGRSGSSVASAAERTDRIRPGRPHRVQRRRL